MSAQILDGKQLAADKRLQLKQSIAQHTQQGHRSPGLAVILVGEDPASEVYVRNKKRACAEVGIMSFTHLLSANVSEVELLDLIAALNQDDLVDGILVQLPLPEHINSHKVIEAIQVDKDVDGFHPYNLGRLVQRRPLLRPSTPLGIMSMFEHYQISLSGKHAVVVGASNIVGRPMSLELLLTSATVTTCHRLTQDLESHVRAAEILIVAMGNPGVLKSAWIKPGAVVIDVGITRLPNGKLTGDIEFDTAKQRASWITPVPGGVGPMTVYGLLKNTFYAASQLHLN